MNVQLMQQIVRHDLHERIEDMADRNLSLPHGHAECHGSNRC